MPRTSNKAQLIVDYVNQFIQENGYSPSVREIGAAVGLRSTAFSITVEDSDIVVHTKGYGHRVGMSQYGADAMALAGSSWEEILAHYYRGTEITLLS